MAIRNRRTEKEKEKEAEMNRTDLKTPAEVAETESARLMHYLNATEEREDTVSPWGA